MSLNQYNSAQSMLDAITLTGRILEEWLNKIEEWNPDLAYVYDDQLSFETAITKYRQDKDLDNTGSLPLPILAFKRSVMRQDTEKGIGKRLLGRTFSCPPDVNGDTQTFRGFQGVFDLEFMYISNSTRDAERFEISYLAETSVSDIKNIDIYFDEMQTAIPYNFVYGELDEKIFNTDNVYYKAITGTINVHGLFFTYNGPSSVIKEINSTTQEPQDITDEGEIVPESVELCKFTIE